MNISDLRMHAQSLRFAFEMGADAAALQAKTQELIAALGGVKTARGLSTGSAALYLVVLFLSHLEESGS